MKLAHHPDDATLASYAGGCVDSNFSLVLDLHIAQCVRCQKRLRKAEQIGALLFATASGNELAAPDSRAFFSSLQSGQQPAAESEVTTTRPETSPLLDWLKDWPTWAEDKDAQLDHWSWRRIGPGVRQIPIPMPVGKLFLLRIAPGTCLPAHGHQGSELTLVLKGSYSDEIGRFTPGCIADLDDLVDHQPIADRNEDCICLVATDAPLRFHGWVPRLFQTIYRI